MSGITKKDAAELEKFIREKDSGSRKLGGDDSSYKLSNGNVVVFRTRKRPKPTSGYKSFFFGIQSRRLDDFKLGKLFVLLVCGSTDEVLVIPAPLLKGYMYSVSAARDGDYKFCIYQTGPAYELGANRKLPRIGVNDYLNNFELLFA